MPFKIGSFNVLPTIVVMTTCLAGVGALPYGVKWLLNGERPARRDPFEKYVEWKPATFDKGAPYTKTYVHMFDREALEAEWRQAHASSAALQ